MKDNIKAGIWIRVSTELQVKVESPKHHEIRARQYINARGWEKGVGVPRKKMRLKLADFFGEKFLKVVF